MHRLVVRLALILLLLPGATGIGAQEESAPVALEVNEDGALSVEVADLLRDGGLRRALHSGLPLRIRLQVALWRDRFFDSEEGRAEWRATVVYDPLDFTYHVETSSGDGVVTVSTLASAGRALSRRFQVPLRPRPDRRYYYIGTLEVETLSLSDLEELQRWLRGDLAPAVSGEEPVENAVGTGVRRLMVRVLGLPARRYRVRTPTFRVPR